MISYTIHVRVATGETHECSMRRVADVICLPVLRLFNRVFAATLTQVAYISSGLGITDMRRYLSCKATLHFLTIYAPTGVAGLSQVEVR